MSKVLTVSVDDWIFEAIEKLKEEKHVGRSETANELLSKSLLSFKPASE